MSRGSRKLCYVAPDVPVPHPSGASVHVSELSASLGRIGYEVHVIARRNAPGDKGVEQVGGFTVHRVNRLILRPGRAKGGLDSATAGTSLVSVLYGLYLRTVFAFYVALVARRIITTEHLGGVVERETSFGSGAFASILTGTPLALEIVGPRYSRLSASRSSVILYYTDAMLRPWVDRRKCVRVSAGVDSDLFRPDPATRSRVRTAYSFGDSLVIGYVGTFQEWHGIDTLLSAARKLVDGGIDVRLLLVGPAGDSWKEAAHRLGVSSRCIFTGPVGYSDVPGLISACDIMVAPYDPSKSRLRKEFGIGFPLKVLEYMACEKPVIASRVEPITSLLEGGAGTLFEPGDAAGLAGQVAALAKDPDMASMMASKGRSLVEREYSWRTVAERIAGFM